MAFDFDDDDDGDKIISPDTLDALRASLERPLGKLTFQIKNQREFDAALLRLFEEADIDVMGA